MDTCIQACLAVDQNDCSYKLHAEYFSHVDELHHRKHYWEVYDLFGLRNVFYSHFQFPVLMTKMAPCFHFYFQIYRK